MLMYRLVYHHNQVVHCLDQATCRRCILHLNHLIQFLKTQSVQSGLLSTGSMDSAPYLLNLYCCHNEPPY